MKLINALLFCFCFLLYFCPNSLIADEDIDEKKTTYLIEDRYYLDHQINLNYEIKSLGLRIAKLDFEVNLTESQFFSSAVIETQGLGDIFSNSTWTFSARGTLKKSEIQPMIGFLGRSSASLSRTTISYADIYQIVHCFKQVK